MALTIKNMLSKDSPQKIISELSNDNPSEEVLLELKTCLVNEAERFSDRQLWKILERAQQRGLVVDIGEVRELCHDIARSANWELQRRHRAL